LSSALIVNGIFLVGPSAAARIAAFVVELPQIVIIFLYIKNSWVMLYDYLITRFISLTYLI